MLTLYTSHLNPKGIQARQYLQSLKVAFNEKFLDDAQYHEGVGQAWKLYTDFVKQPSASLQLPFLADDKTGQEQIVLLGFNPQQWSEEFGDVRTQNLNQEMESVKGQV